MERINEDEGFLPQRRSRKHIYIRAHINTLVHLILPGRQVEDSEKMGNENDSSEEIPLVESRPTSRRSMELRTLITSVTGLILAIFSFVFGVGCGLGIGVPYYGKAPPPEALSRTPKPAFNKYGVPDTYPSSPPASSSTRPSST